MAVSVTPSYNASKHQVALLPSGGTWSADETYTIKITTGLQGSDGSTLTGDYTTSFSTGSADAADMNSGFGGPLLVITSSANAYDSYYAEILRTEGITYFDVKDIATIDSAVLGGYKAAILAEMPLDQSKVDTLTAWVNNGGNLVAMRPDKKLAGLLGLNDASSTRSNQYLKVDTTSAPGTGIVGDSIQYKGLADNYTNSASKVVASLYSDANTATSNPAVTVRSVGSKGGEAMAFTYDLARAVIMLHQGNQVWAGMDRDQDSVRRGNDLFYGNMGGDVQLDWVDMNKIHIPQADEQQRLLVNMLTEATKDSMPMPRFWYLPHDNKAALVFAGDDHEVGAAAGTEVHLNEWLNESKKNCGVLDWECVRATHYIYPNSPISNATATQFEKLGFEVADHPSNSGGCTNFASLAQATSALSASLLEFRTKYPGLTNQTTNRFHCYLWGDWDSIAKASIANGIHYSLDYVAFPASWINGRSPIMTGSGMNMRFTDTTGALLDIHQGVTNFDNTSANPTSINTLLDNAVGSTGYYGMYGTHYDMSDTYDTILLNAARARNIPLISSNNALTWLDGRGDSQFDNLDVVKKGKLTFTVRPGQGAVGLRAMMPISDGTGTLTSLEVAGQNASYTTKAIKGVSYAVFDAVPGDYTVTYSDYDPTDPITPPEVTNPGNTGNTSNPDTSPSSSDSSSRNQNQSTQGGRSTTGDDVVGEGAQERLTPDSTSTPGSSDDGDKEPTKSDQSVKPNNSDKPGDVPAIVWWLGGGTLLIGGASFAFIIWRRKHSDLS
jgi:hypothetical protein